MENKQEKFKALSNESNVFMMHKMLHIWPPDDLKQHGNISRKQTSLLTRCRTHSEWTLLTCTWTHFGEVVNIYKRKAAQMFHSHVLHNCFTSESFGSSYFTPTNTKASEKQNPKAIFPPCTCFSLLQFSSVPHLFFSSSFPLESVTYWPNVPLESAVHRLLFQKKIQVQSQQERGANITTNQFS